MSRTDKILSHIDKSFFWLVKEGLIIAIPLLIIEQIFIHYVGHPLFVRSTLCGLVAMDVVDHLIANSTRIKSFFKGHFMKGDEKDVEDL